MILFINFPLMKNIIIFIYIEEDEENKNSEVG